MVPAEEQDFQFLHAELGVPFHDQSKPLKVLASDCLKLSNMVYHLPRGSMGRVEKLDIHDQHQHQPVRTPTEGFTFMKPADNWDAIVSENFDVLQKCSEICVFDHPKDNVMLITKYKGPKSLGKLQRPFWKFHSKSENRAADVEILIVAFRGTNSFADLRTDIRLRQVVFAPLTSKTDFTNQSDAIQAHEGFVRSFEILKGDLDHFLEISCWKGPIVFTGHSKGAAVGMLGALQTAQNLGNLKKITGVGCITFGCPRVGNKTLNDEYSKLVQVRLHVKQGRDPIVKIPFGFGYAAIEGENHVGPKDTKKLPRPLYLPDHHPQYYAQYMEKKDESKVSKLEMTKRWIVFSDGFFENFRRIFDEEE